MTLEDVFNLIIAIELLLVWFIFTISPYETAEALTNSYMAIYSVVSFFYNL